MIVAHDPCNYGQAPDFQTTNQMTEEEYPSATTLREGLARINDLSNPPFRYIGENLRVLPYREGKWRY